MQTFVLRRQQTIQLLLNASMYSDSWQKGSNLKRPENNLIIGQGFATLTNQTIIKLVE